MTKLLSFLTIIALVSCSSLDKANTVDIESVKVTSKEERSRVFFRPYTPKVSTRSIASVKNETDLSDKNAYFLSLYSQYKTMSKLTHTKEELNVCPQFHNEILSADIKANEVVSLNNSSFKNLMTNPYAVVQNPSLSLNYKGTNVYNYLTSKKVWNKANRVVKKALISHNDLNLKELNQLCETGSSEGFYAFKNMVSYYSTNSFAYSKQSMPAFLKIPVVANILILNNYSKKISSYESNVISSLNISWFSSYLNDLKRDSNKEYLSLRR